MDGRVLTEIFDEEYLRANPPQTTESEDSGASEYNYSGKEEEEVQKRLKDLGYLS